MNLFSKKVSKSILFERLKEGYTKMWEIEEKRLKNPGDLQLTLADKRAFLIASGKEGDSEILEVPKDIKIKKGWRHFWWLEGDAVQKLGWSLQTSPTQVMDAQTSTVVANRRTAGRLSTKNIGVSNWTMILLAAVAAFAIGYILYPQFNHPAPLIEYCKVTANNVVNGTSCSLLP